MVRRLRKESKQSLKVYEATYTNVRLQQSISQVHGGDDDNTDRQKENDCFVHNHPPK